MNTAFDILTNFVYREILNFDSNIEAMEYCKWESYAGEIIADVRETIIRACVDKNYEACVEVEKLIEEFGGFHFLNFPLCEEGVALAVGNYLPTDEDFNAIQLLFNLMDKQEEYKILVRYYGDSGYVTCRVKSLILSVAEVIDSLNIFDKLDMTELCWLIDHLGRWIYSETKIYEKLKNRYGK